MYPLFWLQAMDVENQMNMQYNTMCENERTNATDGTSEFSTNKVNFLCSLLNITALQFL